MSDGWLARRWHVESEFGKYADPLADRLMIDAAVIMLFIADRLPWPALAVIGRPGRMLLAGTRFVPSDGVRVLGQHARQGGHLGLFAQVGFVLVTHDGTSWALWVFWIGLGMAVAAAVLLRCLGLARDPQPSATVEGHERAHVPGALRGKGGKQAARRTVRTRTDKRRLRRILPPAAAAFGGARRLCRAGAEGGRGREGCRDGGGGGGRGCGR